MTTLSGWDMAGAPHDVDGLRVVGKEVQDAPALLDVGLGIGPQAVHQVHKLDPVPDEEHLRWAPRAAQLRPLEHSDTSLMWCSRKAPAQHEHISGAIYQADILHPTCSAS